jgi:integrase
VNRRKQGGLRFRRRFETKKEALVYEAHIKNTGVEPTDPDAKPQGQTFKEAAAECRAGNKTWKRGRDKPGQHRLDWVVGRIGHLPLTGITTRVLDGLVADLEKRPPMGRAADSTLSPATINRYLSAFSGVLKFARDRDPTLPRCKVPWKKEEGHRIHWLSFEQEEAVVRWLTGQGYLPEALAVRVLCASGLRWGEFSSVDAYSCQGEWIKLDKTKTGMPRDVPIDAQLNAEFVAMIRLKARPKYTPMRRHLRAAIKACGYSPEIGIHNLRHSLASRLIANGEALPIVKDYLGHRDIKTTERYVHIQKASLLKAMKNLSPRGGDLSENEASSQVVPFKKSTG